MGVPMVWTIDQAPSVIFIILIMKFYYFTDT